MTAVVVCGELILEIRLPEGIRHDVFGVFTKVEWNAPKPNVCDWGSPQLTHFDRPSYFFFLSPSLGVVQWRNVAISFNQMVGSVCSESLNVLKWKVKSNVYLSFPDKLSRILLADLQS